MYVLVQILNGITEPLWYSIPTHWNDNTLNGRIVHVPLRTKIIPGLVLDQKWEKPHVHCAIRDVHAVEPLPPDPHYFFLIKQLGDYYCIDPLYFIKRISHFLLNKHVDEKEDIASPSSAPASVLTEEQTMVAQFVCQAITDQQYRPIVLHGVTGSGKTEVYKTAILHALHQKKTVVLLLPEVTLAIAFENRLKEELPSAPFYGFHSGKTAKEKQHVWDNLKQNSPMVLIGVHLPILLPITNLGFIIVDEEHDVGYQEKKHPKINSKEVALIRAKIAHIPILLGSATPSITTLYNVKTKQWHFFQLKKRFLGEFPHMTLVPLINKKKRQHFWISPELETAVRQRLEKKEQTIIFINRRGVSFFVQCKQCSFIFSCRSCSVSLTLHVGNNLMCHYCGAFKIMPSHCDSCKHNQFLTKGIGTQKIVTILHALFPNAVIARADFDTTKKRKVWQQTMHDILNGTIDIVVGTQTITKGFHFPRVTLVGIIWADLNLHFPIYNAAETTVQQLIQVAGRAGRNCAGSEVIVQTVADNSLFRFLNEVDYVKYYASEIKNREEVGYPPYKRFAEIELKHKNEQIVEQESRALAHNLRTQMSNAVCAYVAVLGPAKPPVAQIKGIHSRKIYCKSKTFRAITALYRSIDTKRYKSSLFFTPNPV